MIILFDIHIAYSASFQASRILFSIPITDGFCWTVDSSINFRKQILQFDRALSCSVLFRHDYPKYLQQHGAKRFRRSVRVFWITATVIDIAWAKDSFTRVS